jgi:hypothetical protein
MATSRAPSNPNRHGHVGPPSDDRCSTSRTAPAHVIVRVELGERDPVRGHVNDRCLRHSENSSGVPDLLRRSRRWSFTPEHRARDPSASLRRLIGQEHLPLTWKLFYRQAMGACSSVRAAFPRLSCRIGSSYEVAFRDTLAPTEIESAFAQSKSEPEIAKKSFDKAHESSPAVSVALAIRRALTPCFGCDLETMYAPQMLQVAGAIQAYT